MPFSSSQFLSTVKISFPVFALVGALQVAVPLGCYAAPTHERSAKTPSAASSYSALAPRPAVAAPPPSLQRAAAPVALSQDGQSLLPIVISPQASAETRKLASDLADTLKQISGATFAIREGGVINGQLPPGILVGTLQQFPVASLRQPLEIRNSYDGREAYAIRSVAGAETGKGKLLLLGATDLATSHAVWRFLELAGCRWFFPAPEWTVIPSAPSLQFAFNETTRPRVLARDIWFNFGIPEGRGVDEFHAWARHNRMGQSFTIFASHAYIAIIQKYKAEFDAHPEYYGLVNGVRDSTKLCLSNLAVRRFAADWARDYLRQNPQMDMVSLEPSDWSEWCQCPVCAKLGSPSDRAFGLANEVALKLHQEFWQKFIGILGYDRHADPPAAKLEPNVHIELATDLNTGTLTFEEQFRRWPEHSSNRGIYDYLSLSPWGHDRIRESENAGVAASVPKLTERLRGYIVWGMQSYSAESAANFGKFGPGYYVALRLLWDPQTDVAALVDDFYSQAFGPAAPAMRRYYERLDPANKPLFGRDLLAHAYRDIDEATRLAKDRPDVLARLDDLKIYLHFNYLQWRETEARGSEDQTAEAKKWGFEKLKHVYRTRYSYMVHSVPILLEAPDLAKTFNEPSWALPDAPWKISTRYTATEMDANFQEGLAFFQPEKKIERSFSGDVVAVKMPGTPVADSQAALGDPVPFTALSLTGEPLKFSINVAPVDPKRIVHYAVKDSAEKVIAESDFVPQQERRTYPVTVKVPRSGSYNLEVNRPDALISFAPGTPASVRLRPERALSAYVLGASGQWYFYVPKGTQELSLWQGGSAVTFYDPDGKLVREVKGNFDFIKIPISEGMDGRPWRVGGNIAQLVFFNAPNWLALSPDQLLVPRNLAKADGLQVR